MDKVNTHVLLNKDLRDLAKARNISVSDACNKALEARLALPDDKEALIVQRFKLEEELKAIKAKEEEMAKVESIKSRRDVLDAMEADVKALRELWVKNIKGELRGNAWPNAISVFCEKWAIERSVAVDYAQGKKEVM